jgi:hypothetical protein
LLGLRLQLSRHLSRTICQAMLFEPEKPDGQLSEIVSIRTDREFTRTAKGFGGLPPGGGRLFFGRYLHEVHKRPDNEARIVAPVRQTAGPIPDTDGGRREPRRGIPGRSGREFVLS